MDIRHYGEDLRMLVAVDCIIFGFEGDELKVLLIKRGFQPGKGKWSLMGGFVGPNENASQAAARVLYQLTGLKDIYMEQLYTFSHVKRDTAGRVVSIAYFALVNAEECNKEMQHNGRAMTGTWFSLSQLPKMVFDHNEMILKAKEMLRQKVTTHPVGFELLPERFTMRQLQGLYEAIFETAFDKRNFTKKVLSLNILTKLKEKERSTSRKGSFYYVFDLVRYKKLHSNGTRFI